MNILLVSNSDIEGGAARATYRLQQGFEEIHANSQLLVQTKRSDDYNVSGIRHSSGIGHAITNLRLTLDHFPPKFYRSYQKTNFSSQWLPDSLTAHIVDRNPDVVNLHWINNGYIKIESIAKITQPIVWTLHDMWSFTGGCHYDQGCSRYTESCGKCPQLGSHRDSDLSRWIWKRKASTWKQANLAIVAPSRWLADCARQSSLFKDRQIECIPYGINTDVYRPIDRRIAREILQLPQDKYLVLSGSLGGISDKRKGFHLLQPALQELSKIGWHDRLELVVFGSSRPKHPPDLGLVTHYLGMVNDDTTQALLYSAADVFIAPSVQDNLPNTVMEAIACGTPCVAFSIGGFPDMIEHQCNGYLAQPFSIEDLVKGIVWVIEDSDRYQKISHRARKKTEQEFTLAIQARRYFSLFESITQSP
jgi:glycosyltransferase involved in cell wall biosynthesis